MEPQELYYLGHRYFHCLHTQVVSDAYGTIRYIDLNDAQQFGLMRQLGNYLIFPEELCLLADQIYPNRTPVLTYYASAQLARRPLVERRTYRKFNSLIRKYRIRVEHAIADLKTYKYVESLWRHPIDMLSSTVCASLVCRRKAIGLIL